MQISKTGSKNLRTKYWTKKTKAATKTTIADALRQVASSSLLCKKTQLQRKIRETAKTYDDNSHFSGIS
jgi:hypothetical protein